MKARFLFAAAMMVLSTAAPALASVEINGNPTKNMTCSAGVCMPTDKKAVMNTTDLANMLATSDVKIITGNGAVTITVSGPFSWTSTHRLTLDAIVSVSFRAPVEVAGQGAVTIVTNDGGTGGSLSLSGKGRLDFWDLSSALTINGKPYQLAGDIATLASDISKTPAGSFALSEDYDAKNDGTYTAAPVSQSFGGHFEGLGHVISHLRVSDASSNDYVGLFSTLEKNSAVENLTLTHLDITGASSYGVGGLVGMTSGSIANVSSGGRFSGASAWCGGLAGVNAGFIAGGHSSGNVSGGAGGLVGYNYGTIQQSSTSAAVSGAYVGGFVAYDEGSITASSASGLVRGTQKNGLAGGFVGWFAEGSIAQSFATGTVTGRDSALGGFAGYFGVSAGEGYITDDYATGAVNGKGTSEVGGFAGYSSESLDLLLSNAYSTGAVSGGGKLGGFMGWDQDDFNQELSDAYWDFDTSGITDPTRGAGDPANDPGITGLSDAQLKSGLPSGFDPAVWAIGANINNGYPYLIANPPPQ